MRYVVEAMNMNGAKLVVASLEHAQLVQATWLEFDHVPVTIREETAQEQYAEQMKHA